MMRILIPGKPIAQNRPRFARRGKFVTTYSDQETEAGRFFLLAREQINRKMPGAVKLSAVFRFKRPKSHYGTGKNSTTIKQGSPIFHTKKPDTDNLIKFILDCLNSLAWDDDCQIVEIRAIKAYAEVEETEILISEVEE
jgi:Holliday junction resolvase RusA-like endonuclease